MSLADRQRAFTLAMRSKHPSLFQDHGNSDYAINRYGIEVFPGWFSIVEHMLDQIADYIEKNEPGESLQVIQIKTDCCVLCCHTTPYKEHLSQIIESNRTLAARICEQCGNPGSIRKERRWKTVLCDDCEKTR